MPRKRTTTHDLRVESRVEPDPKRKDFTINQEYEEYAAETLVCKTCGGDKFLVGSGDYLTAIKCPVCGYEQCVHWG